MNLLCKSPVIIFLFHPVHMSHPFLKITVQVSSYDVNTNLLGPGMYQFVFIVASQLTEVLSVGKLLGF